MVTVTLEFETVEQATAALQGISKQSPILVGAVVADKLLNVATAATKPAVQAPASKASGSLVAPAKLKPAPVQPAAQAEDGGEEEAEDGDEEEAEDGDEEAPLAPNLKKLAAQLKDTVKLRDAIGFLMGTGGVKDLKAMRSIAKSLKPLVPCMARIDDSSYDERVSNAYKFMSSQVS